MKQVKLPIYWILVFDEENVYNFYPNMLEIGSKSSKVNMRDNTTITSHIDNEKMNFRANLSKFPDFERKQNSWINLRGSFETKVKAACIEDTLREFLNNE